MSEVATRDKPDAVERKVGLLLDPVVVAVVVQDPEPVDIGNRRDDQIDWREAMMPDARELSLGVERAALNVAIDQHQWQREQLIEHLGMVASAARRVAGLQKERQTNTDAPLLEPARNLLGTLLRQTRLIEPSPGRIIDQQLDAQGLAQPLARTLCAALRSAPTRRARTRSASRLRRSLC